MNGLNTHDCSPVQGAGLGLRRQFLPALDTVPTETLPDFFEIAPENWIGMGGRHAKSLRALTERFNFVTHGLSLSIGGPAPLDLSFLQRLRKFLDTHQIDTYSEHLSYTGDQGHLYDLLPIPMTEAAADYVAARVRQVQDILGRRIALENVSTYAAPGSDMSELDFVCQVLTKADCDLLFDVNNLYVNSINHRFDAQQYLRSLPAQRIRYAHIAGHFIAEDDLRIDTHGHAVCSEVWALLDQAYTLYGNFPTLLERDFNLPSLPELLVDVNRIRQHQQAHRDAA